MLVRSIFRAAWLTSLFLSTAADVNLELQEQEILILTPSDPQYANASSSYNRRFEFQPAAIAYPKTAEQAALVVKVGVKYGPKIVARSGGHSYIANCLGGRNGSIVVDLSLLNSFSIDSETHVATFGAGIRTGDLALALHHAGRAMPHGTFPYIGLGGQSGYGGFGLTSRAWGLTLDTIVGLEVVLANGTLVNVSEAAHPDLFWALRGSSSSFGLVTTIHAKTYSAPPSTTIFQYTWDLSAADAASVFLAFQNFTLKDDLPAAWGGKASLNAGSDKGRVSFGIIGGWYAPQDEFRSVIQPLLDSLPTDGRTENVTSGTYIQSVDLLGGIGYLNTTGKPDGHDTFYVKSLMTPQSSPIGWKASRRFMEYLGDVGYEAKTDWNVAIELYGGANSAINAVPLNATAFAHRSSLFTIQFHTQTHNSDPPFPRQGFTLLDGMVDTIVDNGPHHWDYGAYPNYIDNRLRDWQQLYYGKHYRRLQRLKARYDPKNTFSFPQGISAR